MHTKPKSKSTKTASERRRQPIHALLLDLRDPNVREEIRREAALLDKHPETQVIDEWIEAMLDTSDWPPYEWTTSTEVPGEPEDGPAVREALVRRS